MHPGRASKRDMALLDAAVMQTAMHCELHGVWPSRLELAESLGVSKFRVTASIKRLEEAGMLDVEARYDEDGGSLPNKVTITPEGYELLRRLGDAVCEIVSSEV